MTGLLEIREKLKVFYGKNEVFIVPFLKFLLAFIVFAVINGRLGYMHRIDSLSVVLVAALFCSFLPCGFMILLAALFTLLHLYALSMEAALVGLCLYLFVFLLFFRFSPRDSIVVAIMPILFVMKIPYVMPIAAGLLCTPASAVSVGCGTVVYYFLKHVLESATALDSMEDEMTTKLKLLLDGILHNKEMLVLVAVFAATITVVYLIRRMSVDHAWSIAMAAGAISNLVFVLMGNLIYDTELSVLNAFLGTLLAVVVAKVLEFFRFCVDYNRAEKVQFEDDEYYYYVKAVPKMTVAAQEKTVKRINTRNRTEPARSPAPRRSVASHTVGSYDSYRDDAPEDDDFLYPEEGDEDMEQMVYRQAAEEDGAEVGYGDEDDGGYGGTAGQRQKSE